MYSLNIALIVNTQYIPEARSMSPLSLQTLTRSFGGFTMPVQTIPRMLYYRHRQIAFANGVISIALMALYRDSNVITIFRRIFEI